jgi:uncharacterized protein YcnI
VNRAVLTIAALALVLVGTAVPASAHVLIEQAVPRGDGSVALTMTFDHSCDAAPTVELAVEAPPGSELVEGTGPAGWSATLEGERLVFTGPGIGSGEAPRFTIVARLNGAVGEKLLFPTQQTCADGDGYAWTDVSESEDRPAPRIVATAATLAEVTPSVTGTQPASLPEEGASTLQLVIALVAVAALAYGSGRLLLSRAGSRRGR